jgi:TonB-linked SusC/RagA family outer membrane protein
MRKTYKFLMVALCVLLSSASLRAQTNRPTNSTATGTVADQSGNPIVGVTVTSGTAGTTTDQNGEFALRNIAVGSMLNFNHIGMLPTELRFDGTPIRVVMQPDAIAMDEIIVTGFGTMKKSAFAGSVSSLSTEKYKDVPVGNATSLLAGTVSGVTVASAAGGPGSTNDIRVRGFGSFSASNSPLYVIDGVPVTSGDAGFYSASNVANLDAMATLNPNDIESMTVVKDAAAASLYGSRAANGVILIVTKSGRQGEAKVTLRQDYGFTDFAYNYRENLRGDERRQFIYDAMIRRAKYRDNKNDAEAVAYADANIDKAVPKPWNGQWEDWKNLLFRTGTSANTEVSVSGANDKLKYYASLGMLNQQGITYIQDLKRYSMRTNVDYQARRNLLIGTKLSFSKTMQDYGMDDLSYNSPMYSFYHKLTDSDAAKLEDGSYNRALQSNSRYNPLAVQDWDIRNRAVERFLGSMFAELTIVPDLKLRSTLSYDMISLKQYSYSDPRGSGSPGENGSFSKNFRDTYSITSNTQMQYIKQFGGGHNFDALLAYEVSESSWDYLGASANNFLNPDLYQTSNGDVSGASGSLEKSRMVSYVSYANYNYEGKYYLSANYRLDAISRLTRANRWGHFWSASAAWRFSAEPFMEGLRNVVTDGRVRVSYGQNGNQPSDWYAGLAKLSLVTYNGNPAMIDASPVSSRLVWEKNGNLNVGLDLTLWDRVNFIAEYYTRTTTDLLLNSPISYTSGMSSLLMNVGNIRNSGVEFTIDSRNIQKKDFSWNTGFTLTTNKSRVLKLDGDQDQITSGSHVRKVGLGYYNYYFVEFAGINPANGNGVFWLNGENVRGPGDHWLNADGTLNTDLATETQGDATAIITNKSSVPKVSGGLSNTFRYKMFDLSFLFTYTLGGWSEDNAMQKSRTAGYGSAATQNQIPRYYLDGWKQPGDMTRIEGWFYGNNNDEMVNSSTARLHSTDHIRLKSLTFGITLPSQLTQKVGLERARVYASGMNLLTWAKYKEYDPEVPLDGKVQYQTPPMKSMTFGLELVF